MNYTYINLFLPDKMYVKFLPVGENTNRGQPAWQRQARRGRCPHPTGRQFMQNLKCTRLAWFWKIMY
jgi:hypothetical protein